MNAEPVLTKADLVKSITETIAGSPSTSPSIRMVTRAMIETALDELDQRGMLALDTEWDVEYRYPDGTASRHTEDVFDETGMSHQQAREYAQQYNNLDSAPGNAVVLRRFVGPYRRITDTE